MYSLIQCRELITNPQFQHIIKHRKLTIQTHHLSLPIKYNPYLSIGSEMLEKLNRLYDGWEVINSLVKPFEYQIVRNEKPVLFSTDAITFVVRKTSLS